MEELFRSLIAEVPESRCAQEVGRTEKKESKKEQAEIWWQLLTRDPNNDLFKCMCRVNVFALQRTTPTGLFHSVL